MNRNVVLDAMFELRKYGFLAEETIKSLTHEEYLYVIERVEREEKESQ